MLFCSLSILQPHQTYITQADPICCNSGMVRQLRAEHPIYPNECRVIALYLSMQTNRIKFRSFLSANLIEIETVRIDSVNVAHLSVYVHPIRALKNMEILSTQSKHHF